MDRLALLGPAGAKNELSPAGAPSQLAAGRLKYDTDIVDGLENAPEAVNRLFDGANTGKLLVRCS